MQQDVNAKPLQNTSNLNGAPTGYKKPYWRRLVRFAYICAVVVVISVVLIVHKDQSDYEIDMLELPPNYEIKINQKNCKLYFLQAMDDSPFAKISFHGVSKSHANYNTVKDYITKTFTINTLNQVDASSVDIHVCWLKIYVPQEYHFQNNFTYNCEEICKVSHLSPNELIFNEGFTANGGQINVNIQSIRAKFISANSEKGDLIFNNATVSENSQISSTEGNVVFQTTHPIQVLAVNLLRKSYYCTSAKGVQVDFDTCTDPANSQCQSSIALCNDETCSTVSKPLITLKADYGNMYANVVDNSVSINENAQIASSEEYGITRFDRFNTAFKFDEKSQQEFSNAVDSYKNRDLGDPVMQTEFGNVESGSTSALKLGIAHSIAYLSAPWWVSFLSASVLIKNMKPISLRISPGFCPYKSIPTKDEVYYLQTFLSSKLVEIDSEDTSTIILFSQKNDKWSEEEPIYSGYGNYSPLDITVYEISKNQDNSVDISKHQMSSSLLGAFIISAALAIFVGLLLLYYAINYAPELLRSAVEGSTHIYTYVKNIEDSDGFDKIAENIGFIPFSIPLPVEANKDLQDDEQKLCQKIDIKNDNITKVEENKSLVEIEVEDDEEDSDEEEMDMSITNIIKTIPSQFEMIDHAAFIVHSSMVSSLKAFLSVIFSPLGINEQPSNELISMKDIKLRYERYCFFNHYIEYNIVVEQNEKEFQKYGFHHVFIEDASSDAFKKIRFLLDEELEDAEYIKAAQNENSIGAFLRLKCKLTLFDQDQINCREFTDKYKEFCFQCRLEELPITRTGIEKEFKIESIRNSLICLGRDEIYSIEAAANKKKYYKVDFHKMDKDIVSTMALFSKSEDNISKYKGTPYSYGWFAMDLLSVILHLIFVVIIASPPMILPYYFELERGRYSLANAEETIRFNDWNSSIWTVWKKIRFAPVYTIAFIIIGLIYIGASLIDLALYYSEMPFPSTTLRIFANVGKISPPEEKLSGRKLRKIIINCIEWIFLLLSICAMIVYVALVIEWNILGAVLNPTAYLAYAIIAGTVIVYLYKGIKSIVDIINKTIDDFSSEIKKKIDENVNYVITTMLNEKGFEMEVPDKVTDTKIDPVVAFIKTTPVEKMLVELKLETDKALSIIKGNKNDIKEFASIKGIPPQIIFAILAMRQNNPLLAYTAIKKVAMSPPFLTPKGVIKSIILLSLPHSKAALPVTASKVAMEFFDAFASKVPPNPILPMIKVSFPQLINILISLKTREFTTFRESLKGMNKDLYLRACHYFETEKESNSSEFNKIAPYYSKTTEPIFAIPMLYLNCIEIAWLMSNNGVLLHTDKYARRLMHKILKMTEKALLMDPSLSKLLNLVFLPNKNKLSLKGIKQRILKEDVRSIATEIADVIGVNQEIAKLFFKYYFEDMSTDEELINGVYKLISDGGKEKLLSVDLLRNIVRIYGLSNSSILKKKLLRSINYFDIKRDEAEFFIILSSGNHLAPDYIDSIQNIQLFQRIAEKLRIDKNEFAGLIKLAAGVFNSDDVTLLIRSFCIRNGIKPSYSGFLQKLLKLFSSTSSKDVLESAKQLKFSQPIWALLGRKLMSPNYIENKEFISLDLPADNTIVEESKEDMTSAKLYKWKLAFTNELSKSVIAGKTGKLRSEAHLLLTLDTAMITTDLIESFKQIYNDGCASDTSSIREPISLSSDEQGKLDEQMNALVSLIQLKSVINKESRNSIITVAKSFSSVMKLDEKIILYIFTIMTSMEEQELNESISELLNIYGETLTMKPKIVDYALFANEEIRSLKESSNTISFITHLLNIPEFPLHDAFISNDKTYSLSINEAFQLIRTINKDCGNTMVIASTIAGCPVDIGEALKAFVIPSEFQGIIMALLSSSTSATIDIIRDRWSFIAQNLHINNDTFNQILSILSLYCGVSEHCYFQNIDTMIGAIEYTAKALKLRQEFIEIVYNAIFIKNPSEMITAICSLFENNETLPAYVIRAISSLAIDTSFEISDFIESQFIKLHLVELLVLISNHSKKRSNSFKEIIDSMQLKSLCEDTQVDYLKLATLLNISTCSCSFENEEDLNVLNISGVINLTMLRALYGISKGHNVQISEENQNLYSSSSTRVKLNKEIKQSCTPLFKEIGLDPNFALLALRIAQGDFYIIEDMEGYLTPMLPNSNVRNAAMGIVGLLTLPCKFEPVLEMHSKSKLAMTNTFEGACNLLCKTLLINPIVAHMAALDAGSLDYIEKISNIHRSVVASFIVSIGKINGTTAKGLVARCFARTLDSFKYALENNQKADDNEIGDEGDENPKKKQINTQAKTKAKESKGEYFVLSSEDTIRRVPYHYDTLRKEGDYQISIYYSNADEAINYTDIKTIANENMECVWFNSVNVMRYTYGSIMGYSRPTKTYAVNEDQLKHIIGSQSTYEAHIVKALYKNTTDPQLWEKIADQNSLHPSYSWLDMDKRDNANNIWKIFNELLDKLSQDGKGTEYERITMSQIILFTLIMSIKHRINSPNWEINEGNYKEILEEIDCLLLTVESLGFVVSAFGNGYDRIRLSKFISIALQIKISNKFEEKFIMPLYQVCPQLNISKIRESPNTVKDVSLELIKKAQSDLYEKFSWTEDYHTYKKKLLQTESKYTISNCNPYDTDQMQEWASPKYLSYQNECLLKMNYGMDSNIRAKLMMPPKCINEELKNVKEDDVSMLPINKVEAKFTTFEKHLVADDGLIFILNIAKGNFSIIDQFSDSLKSLNYLQTKESLILYKALLRLMTLTKYFRDEKKNGAENKEIFLSEVTEFLRYIQNLSPKYVCPQRFESRIAEDVIMLCHGNICSAQMKSIAKSYSTDAALLDALLLNRVDGESNLATKIKIISKSFCQHNKAIKLDREKLIHIVNLLHYNGITPFQDLSKTISDSESKPDIIINLLNLLWEKTNKDFSELTTEETQNVINSIVKICEYESGNIMHLSGFINIIISVINKNLKEVTSLLTLLGTYILPNANINDHVPTLIAFIILVSNEYSIMGDKAKNFEITEQEIIANTTKMLQAPIFEGVVNEENETKLKAVSTYIIGCKQSSKALIKSGLSGISQSYRVYMQIVSNLEVLAHLSHPNGLKWLHYANKDSQVLISSLCVFLVSLLENSFKNGKVESKKVSSSLYFSSVKDKEAMPYIAEPYNYEKYKAIIGDQSLDSATIKADIEHFDDNNEALYNSDKWISYLKEKFIKPVLNIISDSEENQNGKKANYFDLYNHVVAMLMQLIVGDFPTFLAIVQEIYKPDPLQKVGYNLLLQLSELVQIKNARFTTLMGAEGANEIVKLAVSISTSLISINDAALSKKPHSFQLDARLSSDMYKKFKSQRDEYFKSLVLMLCSIKHAKIEIAKKYIKWINICATENYENNAILKIIADPSFYVQNEESSNDNDKKIEEVSDLLVNLYVGMLKCGPVISKLTNLVYEFVSINTERVNSNARNYRAIAEQASKVFMINPDEAKGIMMFIQSSNGVGDLGAVSKFVAPISKIDINELKAIDAAIAELIIANSEANEFIERQKKLPPQPQFIARWNDIYHRAVQNTAGLLDLFYMLDTDGDGNGSISKGEFMRLMDRLSLKISPFRLDEIFTRCKEDMESEDFNMAEFSAAFEFIILKYRNYSIFEYGTSFAQLAYKFGTALAILLILLIFLLIGISAFSTGGVFNALTNSGLAMAAGFGMEPNMETAEAEEGEGEAGEPDERVVFSMMRALRILKNGEHHEVD